MTASDITQIIASLGFPIVLVGSFLIFFNAKVWPWFTKFMDGFVVVLAKDTEAMTNMASAIKSVADDINRQPTAEVVKQTAVLIARMDEQHLNLSQQMGAMKTEISRQLDTNLDHIKSIGGR